MLYGFSRDGAVPFSKTWTQVDKASGVPLHAGIWTLVCLLFMLWFNTKPVQIALNVDMPGIA